MSDATPTVDVPRNLPRRFRRPRIAVSVFFTILVVAVLALWVRSYWWMDCCYSTLPFRCVIDISSSRGIISVHATSLKYSHYSETFFIHRMHSSTHTSDLPRFQFEVLGRSVLMRFSHWHAVIICALLATLPLFPDSYRYSLRTMLLVTTLVAVVLGLGVWLVR